MRRRGFTLLELVIAMCVSAVIMTSLYQLFLSGARVYARSQARADLQASGLAGMALLVRDLRATSISTLTVETDGADPTPAIALRVEDPDLVGSAIFAPSASFVVYYLDRDAHRLIRKTWPRTDVADLSLSPDPISAGRRLTAEELAKICAAPNGTEAPVAHFVSEFTASPARFPSLAPLPSLGVTLTLEQAISSDQTVREVVSDSAIPRNRP
jgi:prepilin-type N-terminal cleavage/methylation domain-containing protein